MGMLDGLLGGIVGAEMTKMATDAIEQHGGIQALVGKFEQQGMGGTINSWIANGENHTITPEEIHQVLGSDMVTQLAAKLGISPDVLATTLTKVLPQAVDQMTPEGKVAA